jgi:hypothetical protein
MTKKLPAVLAFAGRRIDAPDAAPPHFPVASVVHVQRDLLAVFDASAFSVVVGSAACGADILLLEAAAACGVRAHIVLPFDATRFRQTSVIDRGLEWGPRYDAAIAYAERNGDVIVVPTDGGSDAEAYASTTERIIAEAQRLSLELAHSAIALAIWDQRTRPEGDATQQFLDLAERAGFPRREISTLSTEE